MINSSKKNIPPALSILIILMGSLGDVARGLCLVSHIKTHLPQSRVTWLVEAKWSELVKTNRQIDRLIIFRRAWRLSAVRQLYKDLRQDRFDITLDLQRIFKSGLFSLLSGAKRRIGLHRKNTKELNWVFNNEHLPFYSENLSKLNHYLKFTEQLGLPAPVELDFGFETLDINQTAPAAIVAIQNSFIAVVIGSSWETKDWYFKGYIRIVEHILGIHQLHVVLLGDSSQTPAARLLAEKMNSKRVIDLTGNSLVEMTAVLKAAAAGVGPDSGPAHLAAAVGTPYVTLFGPTPPGRHAPYGSEHLVVQTAKDCVPCYKKSCPEHNRECMYHIHPEMVMEKLSEALNRINREIPSPDKSEPNRI